MAVNHFVRGSSPCWGAKQIKGLESIYSKPFLYYRTIPQAVIKKQIKKIISSNHIKYTLTFQLTHK